MRPSAASTGLAGTPLSGDGWAAGVMFEPAAGTLLTGGEVARWTDRHVDVADLFGPVGESLTAQIRARWSPMWRTTRR
ncbi:MAG: hypothetical protein U5N53_20155 [Mycobacterium sp.]|nr:hypothetical protein [Mycobacterium sp.]